MTCTASAVLRSTAWSTQSLPLLPPQAGLSLLVNDYGLNWWFAIALDDKMKKTFSGILWDLDGVLVDTGEAHFLSWKEILPQYGIPFSLELFKKTFGMNNMGVLSTLIGRPASKELVDEVGERKEATFRAAVHGHARLLPGVLDMLAHFQREGVLQAVASSAPQSNVDVLVDELKIRPFFKAVISGAHLPGKPDPATFLLAAHTIGVVSAECLAIEDAVVGVEAAHRAGMKCIAVTNTNPPEMLASADLVVDSLAHLPPDFETRLLSQSPSNSDKV